MKVLKSLIFKICLISGLFMSTQYCVAAGTKPIIITKDEPSPPGPIVPNGCTLIEPVSATINDIELALYFETSIGVATITVTDDSNQSVYLGTVNTGSTSEFFIPVDLWTNGNYNLTITYTNTTLRGEFILE